MSIAASSSTIRCRSVRRTSRSAPALFFIALAALSLAYSVWQTVKAAAREQERANETPAA